MMKCISFHIYSNSSVILIFYVTSKDISHKINSEPSPKQDRAKETRSMKYKILMVT